jgi:hypothetical protein
MNANARRDGRLVVMGPTREAVQTLYNRQEISLKMEDGGDRDSARAYFFAFPLSEPHLSPGVLWKTKPGQGEKEFLSAYIRKRPEFYKFVGLICRQNCEHNDCKHGNGDPGYYRWNIYEVTIRTKVIYTRL